MRRISALLIVIVYFLSSAQCFAAENLYILKNTTKSVVSSIVEQGISQDSKYTIRKTNPYLALSQKDDYIVVILQNSGSNVYYYIKSNKNTKASREIKKILKTQKIDFEESKDSSVLLVFENQAQRVLTNTSYTYDFKENQTQQSATQTTKSSKDNTVLKGYVGEISKGSVFKAYLQTPINTASAKIGDNITAILSENWVYNGSVIASQGSSVNGTIVKANSATYGSQNGKVVINFTNISTPDGKIYNISTEKIDFSVTNEGKAERTIKNTAKGAAVGALGGLLVGVLSGSVNAGVATAIGAGVGAGGALVSSGVEKGVDAEIPTYTELELKLTKPLSVVLSY